MLKFLLDFLLSISGSICFVSCCIAFINSMVQLHLQNNKWTLIHAIVFIFGCIITAKLLSDVKILPFICTVICISLPAYSFAIHSKVEWSIIDIVITTGCNILLLYAVFSLGLGCFITLIVLELLFYLIALVALNSKKNIIN